MISAKDFVEPATKLGYNFWTGVPCSFLTPFINYVIQSPDLDYVGAASEGEAVGIAAGAHLAGRKAVVICQNSGLGNTVNPLTSLNYPAKIPCLLITTHRGAPDIKDEPQHELMGQITGKLLDTMGIPWEVFPSDAKDIPAVLARAEDAIATTGRPFALLMKKGTVDHCELLPQPKRELKQPVEVRGEFKLPASERTARFEAIRTIRDTLDSETAIIGTTGKIGRELFTLGHQPNQIYIVGSMGCASGIGLGAALGGRAKRKVCVLDGDGAALMKLGAFATIGHYQPESLIHVVLDNEAHESTGAQATVSSTLDFARVAAACDYRYVRRTDSMDELKTFLAEASRAHGPALIHVKVGIENTSKLGRPTKTPAEVKQEFMNWFSA